MNKLSKILLGLSLLAGGALYASGSHGHESETKSSNSHMKMDGMKNMPKKTVNDHMGNHMHEGKMKNHMNKDGMSDEQMKNMPNKTENDHMGNHMHEGKMKNHMNMNGMSDKEMNHNMKSK